MGHGKACLPIGINERASKYVAVALVATVMPIGLARTTSHATTKSLAGAGWHAQAILPRHHNMSSVRVQTLPPNAQCARLAGNSGPGIHALAAAATDLVAGGAIDHHTMRTARQLFPADRHW